MFQTDSKYFSSELFVGQDSVLNHFTSSLLRIWYRTLLH